MQTDKDSAEPGTGGIKQASDDVQEESLGWLLDIDRSEPEEKLFALDGVEYQAEGLSEYEAELAGRPLSRGNHAGDDLSQFVEEEIVISSQVDNGSIFSGPGQRGAESGASGAGSFAPIRAIDHSRKLEPAATTSAAAVEDGSDILGLADDDDMGEKFLTLKRVRANGHDANGSSQKIAPSPASTGDRGQSASADAGVVSIDEQAPSYGDVSDLADEIAAHEAMSGQDSAAAEITVQADSEGWLNEEALKLDEGAEAVIEKEWPLPEANVGPGDVDLELTGTAGIEEALALPEGDDWLDGLDLELTGETASGADGLVMPPQADDWLDEVELDLTALDAPVAEESVESAQAEEWLGDVGLELELTGLDAAGAAEEVASPQAEDWLGEVELDLTALDAPVAEESVESAQAEEWLGDVELELELTGSDAAGAAEAVASTEADDWLGEVELELTGSDAAGAAEAIASTEADDWLGEVELELTGSDAAGAAEAVASTEADDWLGEIELDLTALDAALPDLDGQLADGDPEPVAVDKAEDSVAAMQESGKLQQYDPVLLDMVDDRLDDGAQDEPMPVEPDQQHFEAVAQTQGTKVDDASTDLRCEDESAVENSEQAASLGSGAEHANSTVFLSEAPVTRLVAEPGDAAVANEDPLGQESVHSDHAAEAPRDNVLDYVARHRPPSDEDEFDQYLLSGANLQGAARDLEELEVECTEGILSVDPSADVPIDYHDDFRNMEGFQGDSVSAITSVIAEVMEEISGQVRGRLEQLGRTADAIEVDVMLGNDPESIRQCCAEGFEPVTAVCPEVPSALQSLGQAEVESIYVRLFHGQTNENRNDLFGSQVAEGPDTDQQDASAESSMTEVVFDEDIFNAEFLEDLDRDNVSGDIDALFEDLVSEEKDSYIDVALPPETESPDAADPDELAAQLIFDGMPEQPDINEDTLAAQPAVEFPADSGVDEHAGFGEDIFTTELPGELVDMPADVVDDIDVVFADLQLGEADTGEICGLDVDEFDEADDLDVLEAVAEFGDKSSAVGVGQNDADMGWCIPKGITFNYTSLSGNEIFADFLDAFIEEGSDTVEKLEDAIGDWERDVTSDVAFAPVGRILHTLKGIAKGVGLQRYGTLVHNFETLLDGLPRPEVGAEAGYFRIVNAWLDATVRGLEFVRENRVDVASELPVQGGKTEISATPAPVASDSTVAAEDDASEDALSRQTVSEKVATRQKKRDQQLADEGAKVLAAQQSVRITSEKLDHLLNLTSQAQQLGVRSAQSTNRSRKASAELQGRLTSVRTHIAKIADRALLNVTARGDQQTNSELDALEMDQYSELQEAANILSEAVEDLADLVDVSNRHNAVVEAQLKQQATVISTIGSSIQAARVVPVSRLMPGLRRIVRTVSADLDKSVAFKVLNETGALDRDHYARCQIILEHMVRNALDHGIESPEERLAVGKSTTGRISIDVRKAGVDYFITLSDDGRGIDPYEMRESAFRKGLDIDVDALTDEEAIRLIFDKGLSTASAVSEISGRGVGMDIVLSELQQIGGDIKVSSTVGQGTTFELHIPANVTVNGALFVTAGESSYAVPLNGLIAVEQVPVAEFFNAVELGKTLSLFDMNCEPAYLATLCNGESLPDRDTWGDSVPVIIAGSSQRYMAIAIDNVEEALELVIRSLGAQFANVPGVAGGATTAEGEAIVALDLNLLVGSVASGSLSPVSLDSAKDKTLLALVVDDSRTQRMVTTSQFDTVGVETITAENGLVAIDLLNTTHRLPDVVLLDVEMPVKDGIETLREIRKSVRYKHLPVIMVTSRTGAKHRALAEEAGCSGYMGKPFNFPGLIKQINELTGYDLHVS